MTHFGIICPAATGHLNPMTTLGYELQSAIKRVLIQESYRNHAIRLQAANQQAGGVVSATDIIEQVVSTGKPVLAGSMPSR